MKLSYKPYTKGENKDSCPLNIKRPWSHVVSLEIQELQERTLYIKKCSLPCTQTIKTLFK